LKYKDGDEPDELSVDTKYFETLDVGIVTSFGNLRSLVIEQAPSKVSSAWTSSIAKV